MRVFPALNGVMALSFVVFAALQWNDPDPLGWMLVYGGAAIASALSFRPLPLLTPPAALGAVALVWAGLLAPEALRLGRASRMFASMSAESPGVELVRELFGLLIVAGWMAVLTIRAYRARRAA